MLESMTRVVARYPADGFWYAGVVSEVLTISGFCYVTFPDDERPIITRLSDITCPNNCLHAFLYLYLWNKVFV
jgi:hypothetical protein